MLFLQFFVKQERYVIDARRVLLVIPVLQIHRIAGAPEFLPGVLDYRGQNVPVLDLNRLLSGKKCKSQISTRIILVDFARSDGRRKTLGLMAEKVTEVLKVDESCFASSGVNNSAAAYLGPIARDSQGLIQQIIIDKLVEGTVQDLVFQTSVSG